MRTNTRHHSDVKQTLKCTSKTERERKESQLGCRYSVLLDLPYFKPIEMLLIDAMHNLFWGTALHVSRNLWIGRSILNAEALSKIESRLKKTVVPAGLGRIPVSINHGHFLTACRSMEKLDDILLNILCGRSHIKRETRVLEAFCVGMQTTL